MHLAGDNAHEALSGARGLGAVPGAVLNASSDRPVPSTNAVLGASASTLPVWASPEPVSAVLGAANNAVLVDFSKAAMHKLVP